MSISISWKAVQFLGDFHIEHIYTQICLNITPMVMFSFPPIQVHKCCYPEWEKHVPLHSLFILHFVSAQQMVETVSQVNGNKNCMNTMSREISHVNLKKKKSINMSQEMMERWVMTDISDGRTLRHS